MPTETQPTAKTNGYCNFFKNIFCKNTASQTQEKVTLRKRTPTAIHIAEINANSVVRAAEITAKASRFNSKMIGLGAIGAILDIMYRITTNKLKEEYEKLKEQTDKVTLESEMRLKEHEELKKQLLEERMNTKKNTTCLII